MTLPAGVQTCTVTYGRAHASLGTDATIVAATVTTDRRLVWVATGDTLFPTPDALTITDGVATGEVPFVDQAGFVDAAGDAITNWSCILDASIRFADGRRERVRKTFQVFVGQDDVDLDLVPDGAATDPVVAPAATVTSVAGITGAVEAEPLAIAIEPFLPGGGEGAVQSVNGHTGAVELDAADVGAKPAAYVPTWAEVTGKPTFSTVATSGSYADLSNKPTIPTTPGDIGAATAAQGALADSAVQPGDLATVATTGDAGDLTGTLPTSVLPPLAVDETFVVADEAAMLALAAQRGDVAVRTDNGRTYILSSDSPGTLADWKEILAAGQVQSVNGQTGVVSLSFATPAQGALADSAVQPGDLATVATSGAYGDLTGRPTLGTAAAANVSDFATAAQGAKADAAVPSVRTISTEPTAVPEEVIISYTPIQSSSPNLWQSVVNGFRNAWRNEVNYWRFRFGANPAYPDDAAIRFIVEAGDTPDANATGQEYVDRNLPAGDGRRRFARLYDGSTVRGGRKVRETIVWEYGVDEDPTYGGVYPVPAGVWWWVIMPDAVTPLPDWLDGVPATVARPQA